MSQNQVEANLTQDAGWAGPAANDAGVRDVSSERIRSVLGWPPHSVQERVISMGETMIAQALVG